MYLFLAYIITLFDKTNVCYNFDLDYIYYINY